MAHSCRPLAIDLYAGLGGWSAGLIEAGWEVIGFDIEDMFAVHLIEVPRPQSRQRQDRDDPARFIAADRRGLFSEGGTVIMAEGRTKWPAVEDDWFVEPIWCTTWLLERERFDGRVYDPCCGQGNIVEACLAHGLEARGSDLRARAGAVGKPWFGGEGNCFSMGLWDPEIICNPPYGRAKTARDFIVHFWRGSPAVRKMAVFVNSKFLFGAGRAADLFLHMPPARVWPINPRPSCPPGRFLAEGGKAEGGVENFCWLVWDRNAAPGTVIHWNPPEGPPANRPRTAEGPPARRRPTPEGPEMTKAEPGVND